MSIKHVFVICVIKLLVASADNVPAFIWSENTDTKLPKAALLGHSVDGHTFKTDYLDNIDHEHDVLVFLRDEMELEDITKHAEDRSEGRHLLQHLKENTERKGAVQLASVKSPFKALQEMKKSFDKHVHEIKDGSPIGNILGGSVKNFVTVHLPKRGHSDDAVRRSLKLSDRIIGDISTEMRALGRPYTAIFTGSKNYHIPVEKAAIGRHLLATNDTYGNYSVVNVSDCLVLFAESARFALQNNYVTVGNWSLPPLTEAGEGSYCTNDSAMLNLTYTNVHQDLTSLQIIMQFQFNLTTYFWRTTNVSVEYYGNTSLPNWGVELPLEGSYVMAPQTFSYACANTTFYLQSWGNYSNVQVTFVGFQLQVFNYTGDFGRYNNCVGFFTAGIWSMLLAVFTLFAIAMWGIIMLSEIPVMDRFESAKGKAIVISVVD